MAENQVKQCDICIGCGRCGVPAEESLRVVTQSFLTTKKQRADAGESFVLADIGTTTIAMELYNVSGEKVEEYVSPNPQRIFGADVISRIQAAENPMNARQMQSLVKGVLERGIQKFKDTGVVFDRMYVAANTTMLYLLMGHEAEPLGRAPFEAFYLESESFAIGNVQVVTLPGLSAFLGADVFAGVLACGMHETEEISLLIDLGTNGEMVLGNQEQMIACSTAAGPVFDGLCNKDGQMVWGADLVHLVAKLIENGIVDETGLLAEKYFTSGIDIGGVRIKQEHIRNLQTAKAAIATGIMYLLQESGVSTERVNKVYLAGGFGYFLQEEDAMRIGLLPKEFRGKVVSAGNTALAGAYTYGRLKDRETVTDKLRQTVQIRNLAQWEHFNEHFIQNMDFPNN